MESKGTKSLIIPCGPKETIAHVLPHIVISVYNDLYIALMHTINVTRFLCVHSCFLKMSGEKL